jgi:hypothetical protein
MKSSSSIALPATTDTGRICFGAGFRLPAAKPIR